MPEDTTPEQVHQTVHQTGACPACLGAMEPTHMSAPLQVEHEKHTAPATSVVTVEEMTTERMIEIIMNLTFERDHLRIALENIVRVLDPISLGTPTWIPRDMAQHALKTARAALAGEHP